MSAPLRRWLLALTCCASLLLSLMVVAILLTFSRAAWGQIVYTAILMLALTFITTVSPSRRVRIVLLSVTGTVVLAGIYVSDIPQLTYERHLFYERDLRSVTSNTRRDGEELLRLAGHLPLHLKVTTRPMAQADQALADVLEERMSGSTVVLADAR